MTTSRPDQLVDTSGVRTDAIELDGAQIHYEVRGAGPLVLVIGQPMTSGPFAPLAEQLASDHTVVTYDPRGMGQSTVADPSLAIDPEREADDLAGVIDACGGGPADVVGSSGGAVAALALAARHPERVGTIVAHEPPVTELLPDAQHVRAVVDGIEDSFRAGGSGAAWGGFVSLVMHQGEVTADGVPMVAWPPPGQAGPAENDGPAEDQAPPAPSAKQQADDALFFTRMLKPFTRWQPPVDRLRAGTPRIVIGVGSASGPDVAARSARALAAQLGVAPEVFPGDHGGFMADPAGFADAVRRVLAPR
ncbi:MAG TPA: alpha/beta hydrolase [Microlunatus sp.]|nr:alpha/beta hydrolase [Microlunatus sp.]